MTRNGILRVDEINAVDSFHTKRGSSPKCSVFRLLPHNLIIDIIKVELDRQKVEKENLDYWMERDAIARNPNKLIPYHYRLVMRDVLKLGELNAVVQKGGFYTPACRNPARFQAYEPPQLIPQKKLPKSKWNQKQLTTNYIPAIIRHYSTLGSTMRNLELADTNVLGRKWLKVRLGWGIEIDDDHLKVSIKVIRLNRLRHFSEKLGVTTMRGIWSYYGVNRHNTDYIRGMDQWKRETAFLRTYGRV